MRAVLGEAPASRAAREGGAAIINKRTVRSNPAALTFAIRLASAGEHVDVVLESAAMACTS